MTHVVRSGGEGERKWKIVPTVAEIGEELASGKLVHQRLADAGAAISSAKEAVKEYSGMLKFGIETFDSLTNPLLMPLMMTVDNKIVKRVDPALSYCYDRALKVGEKVYNVVGLDRSKISSNEEKDTSTNIYGLVVRSEWLQKVDKILDPAKIYAAEAIGRFNAALIKAFDDAAEMATKTRKSIHEITSDEYVEQVAAEMADAWDEQLKAPVKEMFTKLQSEYKKVKSGERLEEAKKIIPSLQKKWEQKIVTLFKDRTRPATLAFNKILEVYAKYREMAEKKGVKVTYEAFVAEVKTQLKDAYDEKLAPHVKEVFDAASQYHWAYVPVEKKGGFPKEEVPILEGGTEK